MSWIQNQGDPVVVKDYLQFPPNVEELKALSKKLNLEPSEWIRKEEPEYNIHIKGKNLSTDELFKLMARYPKLIQRPIVIWDDRAVIARPLEHLIDAINDAN